MISQELPTLIPMYGHRYGGSTTENDRFDRHIVDQDAEWQSSNSYTENHCSHGVGCHYGIRVKFYLQYRQHWLSDIDISECSRYQRKDNHLQANCVMSSKISVQRLAKYRVRDQLLLNIVQGDDDK